MSRFSINDNKNRKFVYGYDNRLQYYFLDYIPKSGGIPISLVGELSFPYVYGSAANLLEMCRRKNIILPQRHVDDLLCDLPLTEQGYEDTPVATVSDCFDECDNPAEFLSDLDQWGAG